MDKLLSVDLPQGGKAYPEGITTFGVGIENHIQTIWLEYRRYIEKVQYLRRLLETPDRRIRRFMFLYIRPYCMEGKTDQVPAEIGITVFNFKDGVIDTKTLLIDPGYVPFGQRGDVMETCSEHGLPFPGRFEQSGVTGEQPKTIMLELEKMAFKHKLLRDSKIVILSTRRDEAHLCASLKWMKKKTGINALIQKCESEIDFDVMGLETVLMIMSQKYGNGYPDETNGLLAHEGGAARFMYHTRYDYVANLACKWHRKGQFGSEKADKCAGSVSQKIIYNILYYYCRLFGFPLWDGLRLEPPMNAEDDTDGGGGRRRQN